MRNTFYCLFILLLLSACDSKHTAKKYNDSDMIMLSGEILKTKGDLNSLVFDLLLDSIVIMKPMGRYNELMLHEYRISKDSLIDTGRGFLSQGNGPGEFNVWKSAYDKPSRKLFFLENPGILTHGASVCLDTLENLYDKSKWQRIEGLSRIKNFKGRSAFVPLEDAKLLVVGALYDQDAILSVLNYETLAVSQLNFWPADGFDGPNGVKQNAYMDNSRVFKNNRTNRLLYVCGSGQYIKLFDLLGDSIVYEKDVLDTYPLYTVGSDGLNYKYDEGCEQGLDAYVTDSFIYVRPMECVASKSKPFWETTYKSYPYNYSDHLWVFNWEGELVRKYETDTPFYDFMVTDDNRILYVTTEDLNTEEVLMKRYFLQ